MVRRGDFELLLVRPTGQALPEVTHNGKPITVAAPGESYEIKVSRLCGVQQEYTVSVTVDGQSVGYSRVMERPCSTRFDGFLKAGDAQGTAKQGFVFAKPEESAAKAKQAVNLDFQEGKIVAKVYLTELTGRTLENKRHLGPADTNNSVAKLPEGKKFFLAPSLTTGKGELKMGAGFDTREWRYLNDGKPVLELELRYETAATLLLRGLLRADNPEHHRILQLFPETADNADEEQDENKAGPSHAAAGAAAAEAAGPGCKLKRQRREVKQEEQAEELIDLTKYVPSANDQVMAARKKDQVLQCDLTAEEQPSWRAVKKPVHHV